MKRKVAAAIMAMIAGACLITTSALSAPMDYEGNWSPRKTYSKGDVVKNGRVIYHSLKSGNKNTNTQDQSSWESISTTGNIVVDKDGKLAGSLEGRELIVPTADGPVKLFDIGRFTYDVESEFYFTTPDCSGTPYMDASALVPEGMILNGIEKTSRAFDVNNKPLLKGYLFYPKAPFTTLTPTAMIDKADAQGTCTVLSVEQRNELANLPVGVATYTPISWTAPFSVR